MKQKIQSKISGIKTPTYVEKKENYLKLQLNKARVENKGLLQLVRQYILHSELDFDNANPLLGLCHFHNIKPKALEYLGKKSQAYLVRNLEPEKYNIPDQAPKSLTYFPFELKETLHRFKLLKLASELDGLHLEVTRQNFYSAAKAYGLIENDTEEKLFMNMVDDLSGPQRYFEHGFIDKTQKIELGDFNYIDTTKKFG